MREGTPEYSTLSMITCLHNRMSATENKRRAGSRNLRILYSLSSFLKLEYEKLLVFVLLKAVRLMSEKSSVIVCFVFYTVPEGG